MKTTVLISFLRKIRRSFFGEKSITAYLAYALSEICLVVVGILIAVSINNTNEERKQRQALENIYVIILEDLKDDMKDIEDVFTQYDEEEKYYDLLINDSLDNKGLTECAVCPLLVSRYATINIEKRGYKLLQAYKGNSDFADDSLVVALNQFYAKHIKYLEEVESYIQREVAENLDDWRANQAWFSNLLYHGKTDESFLKYMRTSDYKNKLSYHYLLVYSNYIPYLKSFEYNGTALMEQLSKRKDTDSK